MCDTERQWGHPGNLPGWKYSYHWPAGVPNDATKEAYIAAYATEGFVECDHGDLEEGFVKIALYENDNSIQHTARLLSTGVWSSKLGDYWDISHAKAESVEGDTNDPDRYGKPVAFMKRPRKPEDDEYEKATFTCVGACPYP